MPHYTTEELKKLTIKAIKEHSLIDITEACTYLPVARATFYNHKLDKCDDIKELINKNKVNIKATLRKKWLENDNATTQIALYKLAGTSEERMILSNSDKLKDNSSEEDKEFKVVRTVIDKRENK